jgi:hypothetical protein
MARVGKFLHFSDVTGSQTVTTSFSTSVRHDHTLDWAGANDGTRFFGVVNGLEVLLTGDAAPTKCTVRVTKDAAGDVVIVPDTEATMVAGVTTSTTKSAAYRVDIPIRQDLGSAGNKVLYVFVKVDAVTGGGTDPTFAGSQIVWQE